MKEAHLVHAVRQPVRDNAEPPRWIGDAGKRRVADEHRRARKRQLTETVQDETTHDDRITRGRGRGPGIGLRRCGARRRLISARGPLLDCLRGSVDRDRARKRGEEEGSNHVDSMPGNSARPKCRASEASTADAKISTPAPRIASSGPVGALPAPSLWRTL